MTNIVKIGGGAFTLSGASTHTGTTTVSAGELVVNGSLGATATSIASGAKLRGGGSIGCAGTAQSGAQISPGAASGAVGTLTVGAGLALQGATLSMQLSSNPAAGNDKIVMSGGTLALAGTNSVAISLADGFLGAGTYDLISGGAATTGSTANLSHNLPGGGRQPSRFRPRRQGSSWSAAPPHRSCGKATSARLGT